MYNEAHNVDFENFKVVYFGYKYGKNIQDLSYSNITLNNTRTGLSFQMAENITVDNITIKNGDPIFGDGLDYCYMNNSTLSNIRVVNVSNHKNPATGSYGLTLIGNNNIVHDYYIDGVAWSGTNLKGSNLTVYNFTVVNSGHNGFESQVRNSYFKNITVTDSDAHNFFQVSHDIELARNNIYENIYSVRPGTGYGIVAGDNASDTVIKNSTFLGRGVYIMDSTNITVMNCTQGWSEKSSGLYFARVSANNENHTIIDSSFTNNAVTNSSSDKNVVYDITVNGVNNTKLINVNYNRSFSNIVDNFTRYYYTDILVVDKSGIPINGTTIDLTNEINPSIQSVDGWGRYKTTFSTTNGRTYLPDNMRENSPSIAEFNRLNKSTSNSYTYEANIIIPNTRAQSLSGITPDSSWYRKDPNIPTYTITAIIPNTSSTGPQIIGFAPAEDNPFNPGEKKNFRVWTDEPLTSMEWLVNGSSVLKGPLNYTWTVTDRNTTIEFIGSNADGPVNHKWDLGESSNETSGNDSIDDEIPEQEVIFSPADSVITLKVSEKTVFSVSPDIFTTKEWYINGYPIQNNTTSMTRCWSTAGTRDVTFKGAGSGEPVSHTWTVNVVEEEKNDEESTESIIAITPEYQIVKPKQSFGLDITVDPSTPITGTQIDFAFNSSMASANSVIEGDLFKQKGASTFFNEGDINSSEGIIKHIYGLIIGTSNVSSPGTFATVNLTAGNRTGMAEFSLSNVLISDINSKSVPYTVTNATVLIDTAPAIDPVCCPKSVDEKSNLAFKISAKDADGDRLTLSASGLPEGSSFNRTSGAFAWTPAVGQAGVYTITFKVSDGYLTDSENVTVTVNKLNNPPVINFFEPINSSSFSEGERIGISVNATDAEKQALNYSIKIDGVMYSSDLAYVWETDYSSSGNHTIEVSVSDGIDEAKMQHSIYISECHPRYDVNEDGVVNILDITNVSREYETTVSKPYPRYDTNQDGEINILDLTLVGHHFGEKVE
ncbi:hypothetical protein DU57_16110 [Methanosarcina mazei]|uniref:Dockerin domain-containing protein n=2 Tax=Methanosarcina mazei TaxID=2209 RepID=A0A0F8L8R6_METMZ|nr:hypothetical protein DU57_16110 [Methanosarcina mazei]KKG94228.1 hypothetical protein DU59_17565 [Methanosarcina mazei]KKH12760.1 hypothetical protein DU42_16300 [Methanosarcina mazei]